MTSPTQDDKQRRIAQIQAFIRKQLDAGKDPKAVLATLEEKGVPRKTAISFINQALKKPQPSPPSQAALSPLPGGQDHLEEIKAFTLTQLQAGKSQQEIVDRLLARGLDKDSALEIVVAVSKEHRAQAASIQPIIHRARPANTDDYNRGQRDFVEAQLLQGKPEAEIVDALVEQGVKREKAIDMVMNKVENFNAEKATPAKKVQAKKGLRKLVIGLVFFIGGCMVTALTWLITEEGGQYLLCYGPIIFGLIYAIVGLFEWLTNRQ